MNLLHVTDYSDVANRNLDRVWHYEFPAGTEATDVEACQGYVAVSVDDLNNYADGKVYIFTAYDGNQMTLLHTVSSESIKSRSHLYLKNGAEPENRPSKHDTLSQCWFNVGPASQTVINIKPTLDQCLTFVGVLTLILFTEAQVTYKLHSDWSRNFPGLVHRSGSNHDDIRKSILEIFMGFSLSTRYRLTNGYRNSNCSNQGRSQLRTVLVL